MSPSPGLGEKYFSYLPGTLSHSLASAGGSFLATMLGQTFENSALTLNHFSSPGSVSGLTAPRIGFALRAPDIQEKPWLRLPKTRF